MVSGPEFIIIIVNNMLEILSFPFMQRALIAGVISALLLGTVGVYVVSRQMSFMGDGIAHASLAGVALALLLGWAPLPLAMIVGVLIAIVIFFLEKKTNISSDAAIGMLFTSGLALGVILLRFFEGYQPELISFLFGNILSVQSLDIVVMATVGSILLILLFVFKRQLTFMTLDPEGGYLHGLSSWSYDLLLYIITALSIVLSIKLLGIVLVSALLIIPSSISKLVSRSFDAFLRNAVLLAVLIVILGLMLSYWLDLPSGATIVLTGTLLFVLFSIVYWWRK